MDEKEKEKIPIDRKTMRSLLGEIGERLAQKNLIAEVAIFGGSAIVLQFDFRLSTYDVDYIVAPEKFISSHAQPD